ncbi:cysteine--tRNA ligase [soil metagenome]
MLNLYNTLTRSKEVFTPIEPGIVRMYCCGPTVYNFQHIGNFRTFFFEDILRRVLEYNGYNVTHVMNITDVGHLVSDEDSGEDKMELSSRNTGKTVWDIAEFYTKKFLEDAAELNLLSPSFQPRATEYINEQLAMVKSLEEKGYTYRTSDGIYYDTSKLTDYGKLAKLDISGLNKGHRVEFNSEKKNSTDFALWKFSPPDSKRQMEWDSPWGIGFPGWHIECSAMSKKLLGDHFDIHCGGIDHIPVHHTNELAQSEISNGEKFVNYWVHGEFLLTGNEKMSKSSGDFLTLDVLKQNGFSAMDYRYFMLNAHYKKKLKFSVEAMEGAKAGLANLKGKINKITPNDDSGTSIEVNEFYKEKFLEKINDDLNMPEALAVVWELVKDDSVEPWIKRSTILDFDKVLGLRLGEAEVKDVIPEEVIKLAEDRSEAKKNKDFKKSDELRNTIKEKGYSVLDNASGYEIKKL